MPPKSSLQDTEGTTWVTASLQLGQFGMDLRRPSDPPALADLLNARFLDEKTAQRRNGFKGTLLVDGDVYPAGHTQLAGSDWTYGQGLIPSGSVAPAAATHWPVAGRGGQVFKFAGQTVAWTGDRLLVLRDGEPAIGASNFWLRLYETLPTFPTTPPPRGVPAHLPLMTDTPAPDTVGGEIRLVVAGHVAKSVNYVDSVSTPSSTVYLCIQSNRVILTTVNRATGAVTDTTDVTGTSTLPGYPTIFTAGGLVAVMFYDFVDSKLRVRFSSSTGWTNEDFITNDLTVGYDVVRVDDSSYFVIWMTGTTVKLSSYTANQCLVGSQIIATTDTPASIANSWNIAGYYSSADETIGIIYATATGLTLDVISVLGLTSTGMVVRWTVSTVVTASVAAKPLASAGGTEWVVHYSDGHKLWASSTDSLHSSFALNGVRYNADLASRSFVVGNEVFAWYRSKTSASMFLLCGAYQAYVAGSADRETGFAPSVGMHDWLARPQIDPADSSGMTLTWTRCFDTGDVAREGNVLTGSMNFLPQLSAVTFGKSVYLSGSIVKNWDGVSLLDAGFNDYPTVNGVPSQTTGGSLTLGGEYQWRIHPVRYNSAGERFMGPGIESDIITLTGGNDQVTLTINTIPGVSAVDVYFEVYRSIVVNGAPSESFYFEGSVQNDFTVATVQFVSGALTDAVISSAGQDPTAPQSNGTGAQLDAWAPIGCSILAVVGDRLWGAGGQVGNGTVQFSLLKDVGLGAGFDDLAGYEQVDNEGGVITSVAGMSGVTVIFEPERIYAFDGPGPDNTGVGAFDTPQLTLAAGATSHFGTFLCQLGIGYWGASGPLLLTQGFTVQTISPAVRPLAETLTPVGVQVDTGRMEVVWYCGTQALLWNYMAEAPRWARWSTPDIAGCCNDALITADGRVLVEDSTALGDNGVPYAFMLRSSDIHADQLREGYTLIRRMGINGVHLGDHRLRVRVFYNGSPMWSEEWIWEPDTQTWLSSGDDFADMTATEIDALKPRDRSGAYGTHKKLKRQDCRFVSFEVSDISSLGPTFTPFELAFEIGAEPGLGRTPVSTFSE